jgi:nucleotide-binding universal stress UspA family protein
MATHGRGAIAHALLGSTTEKVVRKACCAVLTIRASDQKPETA